MYALIALLSVSNAHAAAPRGSFMVFATDAGGAAVAADVYVQDGPLPMPREALGRAGEGALVVPVGTWTVVVTDGQHRPVETRLDIHQEGCPSLWVMFSDDAPLAEPAPVPIVQTSDQPDPAPRSPEADARRAASAGVVLSRSWMDMLADLDRLDRAEQP